MPKFDRRAAEITGSPNLTVELEDRTIEKHVPIRASVPEDGIPEDLRGYNACTFVDGDINYIRKQLSVLLAQRIADEMDLFNDVIGEIDKSLEPIHVADLPSMLNEEETYISPKLNK